MSMMVQPLAAGMRAAPGLTLRAPVTVAPPAAAGSSLRPSAAAAVVVAACAASVARQRASGGRAARRLARRARGGEAATGESSSQQLFTTAAADAGFAFRDFASELLPFLEGGAVGPLQEMQGVSEDFLGKQGELPKGGSVTVATRLFRGAGLGSKVRRARVTVVDAGESVQALNCAIYPKSTLELPVLGVDLIKLPGGLLVGMDFSPLSRDPEYLKRYCEDTLGAIRAKYSQQEGLLTEPSARFYGENPEFFSPALFFSRADASALASDGPLLSAFREILGAYGDMLQGHDEGSPALALTAPGEVRWQHTRYDAWHKPRDPAVGMFTRFFGEDWTESFVDEVLFPWAKTLKRRSGPLRGKLSILACMKKESLKLHTRSQAPKDGQAPEKKRVPMAQREVTKETMLQYLVDSKVVYESFEAAVASDGPELLSDTGLERVEVLAQDIEEMSAREGLQVPTPSEEATEYASFLKELAPSDRPRFLCHWYNHHLAHTAGGMMIYNMARQKAFGEDGGPPLGFWTKYPKAGASNDYKQLLNNVRLKIEGCASDWSQEQLETCAQETPTAFQRSGGLLKSLWVEA